MTLTRYAADPSHTRGRRVFEAAPRLRNEFQRDRDRIIHSAAFRRLEYKTQVFVNHEGDLYRTRLTHSLEVAQIARTIARALGLNEDLTEAIALAHDLGHTPFGHAGQDALNEVMKPYGGFEHNLQSLRVVDKLEQPYVEVPGLNLTFETREGILKHCSRQRATKLGAVGQRFLDGGQPSLEAQLTNLADEIAYNSHDVDDGLRAGLITVEALREVPLFGDPLDTIRRQYPGLAARLEIHEVVRRLIDTQVVDLVESSKKRLRDAAPATIDEVRGASSALIGFTAPMAQKNLELKRYLRQHLYCHFSVHRRSVKAQRIVTELFAAFMLDTRLLPETDQAQVIVAEQTKGDEGRARAIADYIAGMTDRYAIEEYARAIDPLA